MSKKAIPEEYDGLENNEILLKLIDSAPSGLRRVGELEFRSDEETDVAEAQIPIEVIGNYRPWDLKRMSSAILRNLPNVLAFDVLDGRSEPADPTELIADLEGRITDINEPLEHRKGLAKQLERLRRLRKLS